MVELTPLRTKLKYTRLHTHFYWTPDARETVEKYFNLVLSTDFLSTTFAESDKNDQWLITSYQLNGSRPTVYPGAFPVTHGIVCTTNVAHDSEAFKCISISLVRANQTDLCRLPVVSGWVPSRLQQTPYSQCDRIPKTGTLIIYKYYTDEM